MSVRAVRVVGLVLAVALTAGCVGALWSIRLGTSRSMYVSEFGARGEPTADLFQWALGGIAVAGALVGICTLRSSAVVASRPGLVTAVAICVSAVSFAVASQVPCTRGCPLPLGPTFSWQDLVHTSAAVLGFVAACAAMLVTAVAAARRSARVVSTAAATAVAVIALGGAVLSLMRVVGPVGGWLELAATSIALVWLALFAVAQIRPVVATALARGRSRGLRMPRSALRRSATPGPAAVRDDADPRR